MDEEKSEFGKGLIVCLLHFANHWGNDQWETIRDLKGARTNKRGIPNREEGSLKIYGSLEKLISARITSWANAATDHLYEIEVPKEKKWDSIRQKVAELRDYGLEIGHGFTDQQYTFDEAGKLFDLSREIAFEIDKLIGLKPDLGQWQ